MRTTRLGFKNFACISVFVFVSTILLSNVTMASDAARRMEDHNWPCPAGCKANNPVHAFCTVCREPRPDNASWMCSKCARFLPGSYHICSTCNILKSTCIHSRRPEPVTVLDEPQKAKDVTRDYGLPSPSIANPALVEAQKKEEVTEDYNSPSSTIALPASSRFCDHKDEPQPPEGDPTSNAESTSDKGSASTDVVRKKDNFWIGGGFLFVLIISAIILAVKKQNILQQVKKDDPEELPLFQENEVKPKEKGSRRRCKHGDRYFWERCHSITLGAIMVCTCTCTGVVEYRNWRRNRRQRPHRAPICSFELVNRLFSDSSY
eukprot:277065_1